MSGRTSGRLVIAAILYWLAVVLTIHVVDQKFDPIRDPLSAYVLGAYGSWMTTTYFALGVALLGLCYSLAKTLPASFLKWIACSLFFVAAAATFVAGIYPMDYPGPPQTLAGRLHAFSGLLAFATRALGAFLFCLAFRRDDYWKRVFVPSLALSIGIIGALSLAIVSFVAFGFAGHAQRLFMALLFAWMIVVALHLGKFSRRDQPSQA